MTLPSKCRAGHCTGCGQPVWRTARAARANGDIRPGQEFILWPAPESRYASVQTPTGHAPGIAFCSSCVPAIGDLALEGYGPVVAHETAHERYAAWYSDAFGAFYRAWLADGLSLEPAQIDSLLAQWQADRG